MLSTGSYRQALAHPMSEFLGTCVIVIVLWFGGTLILEQQRYYRRPLVHLLLGDTVQRYPTR